MFLLKFIAVLVLSVILSVSATQQKPYKAAVVEYAIRLKSIPEYIKENVDRYIDIIEQNANEGVDIVVFPESTLNNAFTSDRNRIITHAFPVPEPKFAISPCDSKNYGEELRRLSCAARNSRIYVVINVSEKKLCTDDEFLGSCAKDGYQLYNTNIVFDRDGNVISRYRKSHLFGEPAFNTTASPEVETFTTDFNVTFGHLICFDMMFRDPGFQLLNQGVRDFIVPMMWYSELPFLTAVQYQQAWSVGHNVNLLVSGASSPRSGSGGSGIYAGRLGAKAALVAGDLTTKVLRATLYEELNGEDFEGNIESINADGMRMLRDHLDGYSWKVLNTSSESGSIETVCHDDFCCKISTKTTSKKQRDSVGYTYMAVAFNGIRTYSGVATGGIQTCGVIACQGDNISTCGKKFDEGAITDRLTFEEIAIEGSFKKTNSSQFPVSLRENLLPLNPEHFTYNIRTSAETSNIKMKLVKNVDNLLSFAVFGRDYSKDGLPESMFENQGNTCGENESNNIITYNAVDVEKIINEGSKNSTQKFKTVIEESVEYNTVDYFIDRVQILLFLIAIYVLEMM